MSFERKVSKHSPMALFIFVIVSLYIIPAAEVPAQQEDCPNVAVAVLGGGPITIGNSSETRQLNAIVARVRSDRVAARFFKAGPGQSNRVANWLSNLNAGCSKPPAAILIGHSLGAAGALKVTSPNVCSRILLDYIDPKLVLLGEFNQRRFAPKNVSGKGRILHFLAKTSKAGLLGRRLKRTANVAIQEVIPGSNHQTIVKKFNDSKAHFLDVEINDCSGPCSGPLSGDWFVLTTAPSSFMCTQVDCDKSTGVCSCETKNTENPIIEGSAIALQLGVCHEGNTLSGNFNPDPQVTFTLSGTVEPRGSPGILDDHVSFAHETRANVDCVQDIISVVGEGTVTDDSGLLGTPNIEGNWQRTDKFFASCLVPCPPPGNLYQDCVSGGSFEILIIPRSMEQSGSTDLDIDTWRKDLTQDYKKSGLDLKCTFNRKTSALDSASVSHR